MITTDLTSFYHFYPANVTLVGAKQGAKTNFMAAAWNTGLSFNTPLFGVAISPKRYTHQMIMDTGIFTCNFLSMKALDMIHACGRLSGRDVDKVPTLNIPLEDSQSIPCPTIQTAYAAYECVLRDRYPVGDHDLFVGEVVAVHTREGTMKDGLLNANDLTFTLYLGSNTYLTTDPHTQKTMPAEWSVSPSP